MASAEALRAKVKGDPMIWEDGLHYELTIAGRDSGVAPGASEGTHGDGDGVVDEG